MANLFQFIRPLQMIDPLGYDGKEGTKANGHRFESGSGLKYDGWMFESGNGHKYNDHRFESGSGYNNLSGRHKQNSTKTSQTYRLKDKT